MDINNKNNSHTTPPQTHIAFIIPHTKGVDSCHNSGTGKNQGRQRTTPCDNRCFNRKESHSKSNKLSSPVIYVSTILNDSVINPPQLSLVRQQLSISSQNTPRDNQCFNIKYINSKINDLASPVIPVTPPLNDSVSNPHQMPLVCQQSSRSSNNTTHELQYSSIPGRTSPDPPNTMPQPSTNNGGCNIYGCMVDFSKLTPAQ